MEKINFAMVSVVMLFALSTIVAATAVPVKPVDIAPETTILPETTNSTGNLGEQILELSKKLVMPHHIAYLNISVRINALKDILHKKGVYTPEDLKRFIALNNIDVKLFNRKVENSVNALSTAQYHLLRAYQLYQQGNLEQAEKHLELAKRQHAIFQDYVADLSYLIDSWKPLDNKERKFYDEDFINLPKNRTTDTVYPDIHPIQETKEPQEQPKVIRLQQKPQQHIQKLSFFQRILNWFSNLFSA